MQNAYLLFDSLEGP
jgi:hypothetical protein